MTRPKEHLVDYRDYCNLESYLFGPVGTAFRENGCLSTFEFFCIVIWKAERAKSRIAVRLLKRGHNSLDEAVRELTTEIARSRTPKEKLYCLVEKWGFRLPMASAILRPLPGRIHRIRYPGMRYARRRDLQKPGGQEVLGRFVARVSAILRTREGRNARWSQPQGQRPLSLGKVVPPRTQGRHRN